MKVFHKIPLFLNDGSPKREVTFRNNFHKNTLQLETLITAFAFFLVIGHIEQQYYWRMHLVALLPIICVLLKSRPTAQFSKLPNGIVQTLNLPYSNCLIFLLLNFLLKGSVVAGKGDMFLLETNDNKVYLAEVDKQKNGDFKSKKELNHDEKETSSHNHETEGANGDYTDSYEAADEQGNESEKINNESEDDDDIIITDSLKRKLAEAGRKRKKKKIGSDHSFVEKDSSEEKKNSKYFKIVST